MSGFDHKSSLINSASCNLEWIEYYTRTNVKNKKVRNKEIQISQVETCGKLRQGCTYLETAWEEQEKNYTSSWMSAISSFCSQSQNQLRKLHSLAQEIEGFNHLFHEAFPKGALTTYFSNNNI